MRTSRSECFFYFFVGLGCATALLCGRSSAIQAQEVQFRSKAGLYTPTRLSLQDGSIHLHQKIGIRVDGQLRLAFSDRFDVTTGVTYIPGYAEFSGIGKQISLGTGSHRFSASTGARYWLVRPVRAFSWEMSAAVGAVFGGQSDNENLFATSTVSGVIGMTLAYQIGQLVLLKVRIQERLYRVTFGDQGSPTTRPPFRVTFALALPFLQPDKQ